MKQNKQKFKVGDKVKVITGYSELIGLIGTISDIIGDSISCEDWSDGEPGSMNKKDLINLTNPSEKTN